MAEASQTCARAFVCGDPIDHSRSPIIHNYWLKSNGLQGEYVKMPVQSGDLAGFLDNIGRNGFVGGNITLPHKEQASKLVSRLDPVARKLGAVNTVWLEKGVLRGANTDLYGFLANLDQGIEGWDKNTGTKSTAIVLGAGGASRAIIHGLQTRGFEDIKLVNRTRANAEKLALHFAPGVFPHEFQELPELMKRARLLVNTTSLGMSGKDPLDIDLSPLPKNCIVTDIVYTPLRTDLLKQAEQRGLGSIDGLGMLLHQAVPGFEKWFGIRPVVDKKLRQLVTENMGQSS